MSVKFDNTTLEIMNSLPERYKYILNDIIKEYNDRAREEREQERFWISVWGLEFAEDTAFEMKDYYMYDFDKKYDTNAPLAFHLNTDRFIPHFTKHDVLFWKSADNAEEGDYVLAESKIDEKHYILTKDRGFYETLDSNKIFLPSQVYEYAKLVKIVYDENAPGI